MAINNVVLMGNLGKDAEVRKVGNGSVTQFSLAVTERWTKGQEKQERTDWFLCELWGKHGEGLAPYLSKGKQICVTGTLRTDSYEKNGQTVKIIKIRVEKVAFAQNSRNDEGHRPPERDGRDDDGVEAWND